MSDDQCTFESVALTDDEPKVVALANAILTQEQQISKEDIVNVSGIGRAGGRPRILKVKLSDASCKANTLRNFNSFSIRTSFGRVFINKVISYLRRLEV
ncbi:MAG: hypothetical protein AAGK05_13655 [Pseudomonadota bacterium]